MLFKVILISYFIIEVIYCFQFIFILYFNHNILQKNYFYYITKQIIYLTKMFNLFFIIFNTCNKCIDTGEAECAFHFKFVFKLD